MKTKNQRLMTFSSDVDKTEAKGEHKFYFSFSKDYIKGKRVLDVGSWTGPFEILIYNLAKEITAVDIEGRALKVLKRNLPKVKTVKALSHRLPFADRTFDVVCFFDVIEHIPAGYELATLIEVNRVLKKGGYLFIATVNKNFWSDLLDPAYWLAGHRHYTKDHLRLLLSDSGFSVEKVKITGSFFTSSYAISFYFFKHILHIKMPTIGFIERKMERDMTSPGFTQISIRAKKIA
ncbi:MAG: class I SAM-dependent methyltransferase [Candidatus Levybacteria bacterium]|nr:class I SAM-dependent methyltransferase [Candidatus Levybacteria bacterium]